jgi:predicted ATPase/DNA-binding winged helix-turn-helix (wHTH) protein
MGREPTYTYGSWELNCVRRELRSNGVLIPIGSRAYEILEAIIQAGGGVVTKYTLMAKVWPNAIVEENTLYVHIVAIRKALGNDRGLLKTVSGRGYRVLGQWQLSEGIPTQAFEGLLKPQLPAPAFHNNLPVAIERLTGRAAALQDVRKLLSASRTVTLTGPGGIGKTALALEVARSVVPTIGGDILLVELASVAEPSRVLSTVASALMLQMGHATVDARSVAQAIGDKRLLLLLDNCEHVIDEASSLVDSIVSICPQVSILATSREALRTRDECVYQVPPLDIPPEYDERTAGLLEHSAVALFNTRMKSLWFDFSPRQEDLVAMAILCRQLDGLPLAIELAAARAAVLGLSEVVARLDNRVGLLAGVGRRTARPQHRSLRAMLNWSYGLLPDAERRLLRCVSVFAGSFTIEAAEAVVAGSEPGRWILGGVASLVEKSLVTFDGNLRPPRWRLLEVTRSYASDLLRESGEFEQIARRHAEFFRNLFHSTSDVRQADTYTDQLVLYMRDIDNCRAALDWAFSPVGCVETGIFLTSNIVQVWLDCSLLAECKMLVERALDRLQAQRTVDDRSKMQLNIRFATALLFLSHSLERIEPLILEALSIAESLHDADSQLLSLFSLWQFHSHLNGSRLAQRIATAYENLARSQSTVSYIVIADRMTGTTLHYRGDQERAQAHLQRVLDTEASSVPRSQVAHFQEECALTHTIMARVLLIRGCLDRAAYHAKTSLDMARVTGQALLIHHALCNSVCPVAVATGNFVTARESIDEMTSLGKRNSIDFWTFWNIYSEGELTIRQGDFARGTALLRMALDTDFKAGGMKRNRPYLAGFLAVGLGGMGRRAEALAVVDEARVRADHEGNLWCVAELHRIKGELLAFNTGDEATAEAEACFIEAATIAHSQGALLWELRAAVGHTRLYRNRIRSQDARQRLADVYGRFTEGLATADLVAARSLLQR